MLRLHEPARLVGPDRERCQADGAEGLARVTEEPAVAVAGISNMIDRAGRRGDDEGGPQSLASVKQATGRPVIGRREVDSYAVASVMGLSPVIGLYRRRRRNGSVVAKRRDDRRLPAAGDLAQRGRIEMVVVSMRDHQQIDGRQCVEGDAGRIDPLWSGNANGTCSLRVDRIDQDVEARNLIEQAGVADQRNPEPGAADPLRRHIGKGTWRKRRPRGCGLSETPAQQPRDTSLERVAGNEESRAIEVIAHGT
jgi:hypothetical protein